jgi:hypothetical protein
VRGHAHTCTCESNKASTPTGRGYRWAPGGHHTDGTLFKDNRGYWVGGVELPPGPDGKRRQKRVVRKDRNECMAELRKLRAPSRPGP